MLRRIFNQSAVNYCRWLKKMRGIALKRRQRQCLKAEMTGEISFRRVEIKEAAEAFCKVLLNRNDETSKEVLVDLDVVAPFIDQSVRYFRKKGYEVCMPGSVMRFGRRRRCALRNCGFRVCRYCKGQEKK